MKRKSIPSVRRHAVWSAYHEKCGYCGTLVFGSDVHVDHIIPLSAFSTPEVAQETRLTFGLPLEFDVNGVENLIASCARCNSIKSDFRPYHTGLLIAKAVALAPKVRELELKIIGKLDLTSNEFLFLEALKRNGLGVDEILRMISDQQFESGKFKISNPEIFYGMADPGGEYSVEDIFNQKFSPDDELTLMKEDSEIQIREMSAYVDAIDKGYRPICNAAFKLARSRYELPLQLIDLVANAESPSKFPFSHPKRGIHDLDKIPCSLFTELVEHGEEPISIRLQNEEVAIDQLSSNHIRFATENDWLTVFEVMRADFTGEGSEELLVLTSSYPRAGTYMGLELALLRSSEGGDGFLAEVVPFYTKLSW